jgi:SAM-dependent methyltransferase
MIPEHRFKDFLRDIRRKVKRKTRFPAVGDIELGTLDRVTPVSSDWGFDRGRPVDRYYIEIFLHQVRDRIAGRVLEVADNAYTRRFGGDAVTSSDILHDAPGHQRATIFADLTRPDEMPTAAFDCVICTQTLQLVYDLSSTIQSLHTLLKPGGFLLLTVPGITAISREDMDRHGDFWRFTSASIRRVMQERFDADDIDVQAFGNVYAATAFLHGLAVEELDQNKLDVFDRDYEVLLAAVARKRVG